MLNGGTIDHIIKRQHLKADIVERVCGVVGAFCNTQGDIKLKRKEETPFFTSVVIGDYDFMINVAASGHIALKSEFFDEGYDGALPECERNIRFAVGDDVDAVMAEIVINIIEMDEKPLAQRMGQFISNTYFSEAASHMQPSP